MPPPESPADRAEPAVEAAPVPPDAAPPGADGPVDPPGPSITDEPSLAGHLGAAWRDLPVAARWAGVAVVVLLLGWLAASQFGVGREGPSDEELAEQAARDRAQWAAMRRLSPTPIGDDPIADALGPGDAERADDRYADYYVHEADSVAFSVLVTSGAFSPDLAVRLPSGETLAASDLLGTDTRAEIDGLQGPGRFEIVVTSRDTRAEGPYEIAVVRARPADSLYVDGEARLDSLGGGPRRAGRYERAYGVATDGDLPVIIRVISSAFVPRVQLIAPNGEVGEDWATVERRTRGDSLHGTFVRYVPGWEAPYRLLVTSERPGATGPFALDAVTVPVRDLRVGDGGARGELGDASWLEGGRYVDTYRFRTPKGQRARVEVQSEAFAPGFRLWRVSRQARVEVTAQPNPGGASTATYEGVLEAGEYFLEVTSAGDPDEPPDAPEGGEYGVVVRAEALETEDAPPAKGDRPAPTRSFSTSVVRSGESGGDEFEVGVTTVTISYPNQERTRVQLSVTVRSVDYTGNWAPWESFVSKGYLVDDRGRRYDPSTAESTSPSGGTAEPGTARRGTVVFYYPEVIRGHERVVFVASIGERTLTLPIPVP